MVSRIIGEEFLDRRVSLLLRIIQRNVPPLVLPERLCPEDDEQLDGRQRAGRGGDMKRRALVVVVRVHVHARVHAALDDVAVVGARGVAEDGGRFLLLLGDLGAVVAQEVEDLVALEEERVVLRRPAPAVLAGERGAAAQQLGGQLEVAVRSSHVEGSAVVVVDGVDVDAVTVEQVGARLLLAQVDAMHPLQLDELRRDRKHVVFERLRRSINRTSSY